jgi:lipid II:glycine glycyltransferase (peptidoglycan interpeptide bridge formation enzyme)
MMLKELTNEEFTNFSKNYKDYSLYQTSEYATLMNRQYFENIFVGMIDDNNIMLAAAMIIVQKLNGFKYAYSPRGFLLDYNNFELLEKFTYDIKKFLGKKDIIAIKISPLIIKSIYDKNKNLVYNNSNFDNIFNALKKLDYYHLGFNNFFEAYKPRFEAIIDTSSGSPITLFRNIKKTFRTKIRNAENDGIKIYRGNDNELNYIFEHSKDKYPRGLKYLQDCYHQFNTSNMIDYYYAKLDTRIFLEQTQMKYQNQESETSCLNNEVINQSGKNSNKIITQKIIADQLLEKLKKQLIQATNFLKQSPEGIVIASAFAVKHQKEIYILIDGYDENYKQFSAKHLLLWKLIEKYSLLGYTKFNLGGITNISIDNEKYDSLREFKLNMGANVVEYIGDLELVTNSTLYFVYRQKASLMKILNTK